VEGKKDVREVITHAQVRPEGALERERGCGGHTHVPDLLTVENDPKSTQFAEVRASENRYTCAGAT